MDSKKEIKNEKEQKEIDSQVIDDSSKKEMTTDMKKFITKVDNRVKTKVNDKKLNLGCHRNKRSQF